MQNKGQPTNQGFDRKQYKNDFSFNTIQRLLVKIKLDRGNIKDYELLNNPFFKRAEEQFLKSLDEVLIKLDLLRRYRTERYKKRNQDFKNTLFENHGLQTDGQNDAC